MDRFIEKKYTVLEKPFTRDELVRGLDESGYIEGVIRISLSSLIDSDFENFLDLISHKLIGSICLSSIDYHIVGCGGSDEVLLFVEGHADDVYGDADDPETEDEAPAEENSAIPPAENGENQIYQFTGFFSGSPEDAASMRKSIAQSIVDEYEISRVWGVQIELDNE